MTLKNTLQALGLRHRSRKSIENKSMPAVEPQPILNQLDNDFIRDEITVPGCLRRFQSELCPEIFFTPQNRARGSNRNTELTSNHLGLSSLSGTRRAQKHESSFHLAAVKKDCHSADYQDRDSDIKPHQRALARRLAPIVRGSIETGSPDSALAQEAVIMPLNEMGFDLPHRIENHAHDDQQARASEKLRCDLGDI